MQCHSPEEEGPCVIFREHTPGARWMDPARFLQNDSDVSRLLQSRTGYSLCFVRSDLWPLCARASSAGSLKNYIPLEWNSKVNTTSIYLLCLVLMIGKDITISKLPFLRARVAWSSSSPTVSIVEAAATGRKLRRKPVGEDGARSRVVDLTRGARWDAKAGEEEGG